MSFYCDAARDCGCTLWNHGKVDNVCIELDCMNLVETYDFRKCNCGTDEAPILYGEGIARQYVESKSDNGDIAWSSFDGYVVECPECGAITGCFMKPEEAVSEWNAQHLHYSGDT